MCTTFQVQKAESILLGQNYDFYYEHGLIVVSPRGIKKDSLKGNNQTGISWVSRYGNVTFTQFGRELPMSGMNEKGLTVAMMYHEDGEFSLNDNRKSINELQWIQYQLDSYASVDEVIAHLHEIRLEKSMYVLHYMIVDPTGRYVLIEFIRGKPVLIEKAEYLVSTNTSYKASLSYARQYDSISTKRLSRTMTSLDRFTLAYRLVKELHEGPDTDLIKGTFRVLSEISIIPVFHSQFCWTGVKIPSTFTAWSIIFDTGNRMIYYKSQNNHHIRHFSLNSFHFGAEEPVLSLAIDNMLEGEIASSFAPYCLEDNARIIKISYGPVQDQFTIEMQKELIEYPESFKRIISTQ